MNLKLILLCSCSLLFTLQTMGGEVKGSGSSSRSSVEAADPSIQKDSGEFTIDTVNKGKPKEYKINFKVEDLKKTLGCFSDKGNLYVAILQGNEKNEKGIYVKLENLSPLLEHQPVIAKIKTGITLHTGDVNHKFEGQSSKGGRFIPTDCDFEIEKREGRIQGNFTCKNLYLQDYPQADASEPATAKGRFNCYYQEASRP